MLFQWTTHYIKASSYEIGGNHGIDEKKYYELLRGMETRFHQKIVPVRGHGSKWDILCGIDKSGDSQFLPYIYLLIFLFIQTLTLSPSSASMDEGDIQPSFH